MASKVPPKQSGSANFSSTTPPAAPAGEAPKRARSTGKKDASARDDSQDKKLPGASKRSFVAAAGHSLAGALGALTPKSVTKRKQEVEALRAQVDAIGQLYQSGDAGAAGRATQELERSRRAQGIPLRELLRGRTPSATSILDTAASAGDFTLMRAYLGETNVKATFLDASIMQHGVAQKNADFLYFCHQRYEQSLESTLHPEFSLGGANSGPAEITKEFAKYFATLLSCPDQAFVAKVVGQSLLNKQSTSTLVAAAGGSKQQFAPEILRAVGDAKYVDKETAHLKDPSNAQKIHELTRAEVMAVLQRHLRGEDLASPAS